MEVGDQQRRLAEASNKLARASNQMAQASYDMAQTNKKFSFTMMVRQTSHEPYRALTERFWKVQFPPCADSGHLFDAAWGAALAHVFCFFRMLPRWLRSCVSGHLPLGCIREFLPAALCWFCKASLLLLQSGHPWYRTPSSLYRWKWLYKQRY